MGINKSKIIIAVTSMMFIVGNAKSADKSMNVQPSVVVSDNNVW